MSEYLGSDPELLADPDPDPKLRAKRDPYTDPDPKK
jgi:hypothetical protein